MGKIVDGIEWDGNGHSWLRPGRIHGEQVALIRKLKNHTRDNSGNWEVEINGVVFDEKFRNVEAAQKFAATKVFSNQ